MARPKKTKWDERALKILEDGYENSIFASDIAKEIGNGLTKSAVLAQAHRLKLISSHRPGCTVTVAMRRKKRLDKVQSAKRPKTVPGINNKKTFELPPMTELEASKHITIDQLRDGVCHAVTNDDMHFPTYCGIEATGQYCAKHQAAFFCKPAQRNRPPYRTRNQRGY